MHIFEVPEEGNKENGIEAIFEEMMAVNCSKLTKTLQSKKALSISSRINMKKITCRHVVVKCKVNS
jgi:hypothetical protein